MTRLFALVTERVFGRTQRHMTQSTTRTFPLFRFCSTSIIAISLASLTLSVILWISLFIYFLYGLCHFILNWKLIFYNLDSVSLTVFTLSTSVSSSFNCRRFDRPLSRTLITSLSWIQSSFAVPKSQYSAIWYRFHASADSPLCWDLWWNSSLVNYISFWPKMFIEFTDNEWYSLLLFSSNANCVNTYSLLLPIVYRSVLIWMSLPSLNKFVATWYLSNRRFQSGHQVSAFVKSSGLGGFICLIFD